MIDPNEYRRFSTLYDTMLGIPPWARFVRYANNVNSISVIALALYIAFTRSLWPAVGYAFAFFVVQTILISATTGLSERFGMVAMLLVSTAVLIGINIALVWWLFFATSS